MKFKGSISLYFALTITIIFSVVLSVTELAKIHAEKLYLQIATDSALDSMLSLYHRKLYDYYNLYGVEYLDVNSLETEYLSYMKPYLSSSNERVNSFYKARINEDGIYLKIDNLISNYYLEKEIKNYMNIALVGKVIDFLGNKVDINSEVDFNKLTESAKEIYNDTKKSSLYSEINERYFDFKDDIKTLENHGKKVSEYINFVNNKMLTLRVVSTSGSVANIYSVANDFKSVNSTVENLINSLISYQNSMNDFRKVVNDSKDRFERDKEEKYFDINSEVSEFVESEFETFLSFVDEESELNKKVVLKIEESQLFKSIINEYSTTLEYFRKEMCEIEEEISKEKRKKKEDRDNDYIRDLNDELKDIAKDAGDYLKDIKDELKDLRIEEFVLVEKTGNHSSEETKLNKIIDFKNGLLLDMVLDKERINSISDKAITLKNINVLTNASQISVDKIILTEYELDKFNYFNRDKFDEPVKSNSTSFEIERLINGNSSDKNNLKFTISKILLIRIAMNVLSIYTNSSRRQAARAFTYTIFGGFSRILAEAMFLLVLTAWGTAQSIADIRKLLTGKKVKFIHTNDSWTIDLQNLFNITNFDSNIEYEDDKFPALSYKDYLRILLFITNQSDINSRMVALIDKNIKNVEGSFDIEKILYMYEVENTFVCKHFFTNFIFMRAKNVVLDKEYTIKTKGYRCYYTQ